jgi:hypothetical protein
VCTWETSLRISETLVLRSTTVPVAPAPTSRMTLDSAISVTFLSEHDDDAPYNDSAMVAAGSVAISGSRKKSPSPAPLSLSLSLSLLESRALVPCTFPAYLP